ncbi:MAG: transcriptional repressor [Bacteroidales bacterium]|nr:transcriptional repressor [Bacteroidales bacterium]
MRISATNIPDIQKLSKILKDKGMRMTPQRASVHRAMMTLVHASADMVAGHLAASGITNVTVASVYNILSSMADKGIYGRRFSSNNKMYFDIVPSKHLHLYDTKNNEFKDITDTELYPLVEAHLKGRRFRGYRIDRIEIQVVCHATGKKTK